MSKKREEWWVGRAKFLKHKAKPRWKVEAIAEELGRTVPEIRRALGIKTLYTAPIEGPREGEPEWAPRARELRYKKKLSVQKIADTLDVPYSQVYKALHYQRKMEADKRSKKRNDGKERATELRRAARKAAAPKCERCGDPLSSTRVTSRVCRQCTSELWSQRIEEAVEFYNAGWPTKEIAEHMGERFGTISVMVTMARKRGIHVVDRREPNQRERRLADESAHRSV